MFEMLLVDGAGAKERWQSKAGSSNREKEAKNKKKKARKGKKKHFRK
jgi:hypothetical protein